MFNVTCETCSTNLGRVKNLMGMTDKVREHIKGECGARRVRVTCLACDEFLITGPDIWTTGEDRHKRAVEHDSAWEDQHHHWGGIDEQR